MLDDVSSHHNWLVIPFGSFRHNHGRRRGLRPPTRWGTAQLHQTVDGEVSRQVGQAAGWNLKVAAADRTAGHVTRLVGGEAATQTAQTERVQTRQRSRRVENVQTDRTLGDVADVSSQNHRGSHSLYVALLHY